ncbi:MAG: hypothetical protein Q4C76_10200 [Bacillota bacterium]|nr:hypothetical protein [Bacillota bacterium]
MKRQTSSGNASWSLWAVLGIVSCWFSFLPLLCAGAAALNLLAIWDCRRKAKRGTALAVSGLVVTGMLLLVQILAVGFIRGIGWGNYAKGVGMILAISVALWALLRVCSRGRERDTTAPPSPPPREKEARTHEPANRAEMPAPPSPPPREKEARTHELANRAEMPANREKFSHLDCKPIEELAVTGTGPYDIRLCQAVAVFLEERGYTMTRAVIGGGSTEVSHTGAVAYRASYDSAARFLERGLPDYWAADQEAGAEYGGWFTGLNYQYIVLKFEKPGARLRVESWGAVTIDWDFDEGCDDTETIRALIRHLRKEPKETM